MEKVSFENKPKKSTEQLRRENEELRRKIAEIKGIPEVPRSVAREIRSENENMVEYRRSRLGALYSFVNKMMIGAVLLAGADVFGSYLFFEARSKSERLNDKDLDSKDQELKKIFGSYYSFSKGGMRRFIGKQSDIAENLWSGIKKNIGNLETDQTIERLGVEVSAIETGGGKLSPQVLGEYLKSLPKDWVEGEVAAIVQSHNSIPVGYKGVQTENALAVNTGFGKSKIIFSSQSKDCWRSFVVESLGHEIAHSNDWERDDQMTYTERVELLFRIAHRLSAGNRFRSTYVESIEGDTAEEKNYYRAVEYWAEICAQYFIDPTALHIEDYQIVDEQIRKTDPHYNPIVTSEKRANIIKGLLSQKVPELVNPLLAPTITESGSVEGDTGNIALNYDTENKK